MKFIFKTIVILLVVAAIISALIFWQRRASLKKNGVDTTPTEQASRQEYLSKSVNFIGTVNPSVATAIRSEISGRIKKLNVEDGDKVTENQVLLEIDASELESEFEAKQRRLEASVIRLNLAKLNHQRAKKLLAKGYTSKEDYEKKLSDFQLAQNQLETERAELAALQEKLNKTQVRAPHAGYVINLNVIEGQVLVGATGVSAGDTPMTIAKLDELSLECEANEIDVASIKLDDKAEIRFDSMPEVVEVGTVSYIAPSAARNKNNSPVFPVRINFRSKNKLARPGITGSAEIKIANIKNALVVPLEAIFTEENDRYVFVKKSDIQEDSFEKRKVEIGVWNDSHVQVVKGLAENDVVALSIPLNIGKVETKKKWQKKQKIKGRKMNRKR